MENRICVPQQQSNIHPSTSVALHDVATSALVPQLEARLAATEQEHDDIDRRLGAVREKIDAAIHRLRKRPSVNGDEVRTFETTASDVFLQLVARYSVSTRTRHTCRSKSMHRVYRAGWAVHDRSFPCVV